jgi:hypothetical protein
MNHSFLRGRPSSTGRSEDHAFVLPQRDFVSTRPLELKPCIGARLHPSLEGA